MADPPPKPKVGGSLRDRIAMFEQKPAEPAAAPPPGAPRGKVGTWKPKPLEREHAPAAEPPHKLDMPARAAVRPEPPSPERKPKAAAGMSAADAQASIHSGGAMSMKERMAALAGKGGFGGPAPALSPPVPATTKPGVHKPSVSPRAVSPTGHKSPDLDTMSTDTGADTTMIPATVSGAASDTDADATATGAAATSDEHIEPQSEPAGEDKTEEELERERRAAIAARLARLGGTRLGMVPQYGRPPVPTGTKPARKESRDAEEAHAAPAALVATPFAMASKPDAPTHIDLPERKLSATEVPLPPSVAASSPPVLEPAASPPASMPMPAMPKRAPPPRKKVSKTPAATAKVEEAPPAEAAPVTVDELAKTEVSTEGDDKKADEAQDEAAPEPRPLLQPDAPASSDLSTATLAHAPLPESVIEAREASSEPESTPPPAKYGDDAATAAEPTPAEKVVESAATPEQGVDNSVHGDGPHVYSTLEQVDHIDSTTTAAPSDTNLRPSQDEPLGGGSNPDEDGRHDISYESRAAANLVDVRPEQSRAESDDTREDVASVPTHASSAAANLVDVEAEQQAEDEAEERKAYLELVSADKVLAVPEEKEYVEDMVEAAALDAGKDDKPVLLAHADSPVDAPAKVSATSAHPEAGKKDENRDWHAKSAGTTVDVEVVVPTTVRPDVVVDTHRANGKDEEDAA